MLLTHPLITEKTSNLASQRKYVFRIDPRGNKSEIKKEVEKLYNVKVTGVNIVRVKSKKRRVGRVEGRKPGFKKAIVTLKKGNTIEL